MSRKGLGRLIVGVTVFTLGSAATLFIPGMIIGSLVLVAMWICIPARKRH
ncbi:MAG: hypothetical protein FWC79_01375 [Oscillospiraceae bacterium]|nr:hypothetical protein [Oscillospiraceae bacterium]